MKYTFCVYFNGCSLHEILSYPTNVRTRLRWRNLHESRNDNAKIMKITEYQKYIIEYLGLINFGDNISLK